MRTTEPIAVTFRCAREADRARVIELVREAGLETGTVMAAGAEYLVGEADGRLVACAGLETEGEFCLLRSVAVSPGLRGRGLGARVVAAAVARARGRGVRRCYLFSTEAGAYFERLGWRRVEVAELVAALANAAQVRDFARRGTLAGEVAYRRDLAG